MPGIPTHQLAIDFPGEERQGCQFRLTRDLDRHRLRNNLLRKLFYVRRFFPELEGKVLRVGITRAANGMAVPGGSELWFNPTNLSYHTVAHEFVHLLQGEHVPAGEKSCDLFALARHWTLNDEPPSYLKIPRGFCDEKGRIPPRQAKMLFAAAVRALELRREGKRFYIVHFEKTLESMHRELSSTRPENRHGWTIRN